MNHNPALTILDPQFEKLVNTNFDIQILDADCAFSEGPVWNKKGYYLFSDIPKNEIYKIAPGSKKEVYLQQSGCTHNNLEILAKQIGSNGLAYDNAGTLFVCQHGNGAVAISDESSIQPLISSYKKRRFNSPNDLILHPDGTLFFTDPPYGLKDQQLVPDQFQPVAGLYCYRNGIVTLLYDGFAYPNGVCLSPDGGTLYCCSNKPAERFIVSFNTKTLAYNGILCHENSDGIKCDKQGNLWLCTKEGIVILNNSGERLAKIELPTVPANCCWGGPQEDELFITARENIFIIKICNYKLS